MWKPSAPKRDDPEARQRAVRALVALTAVVLVGGFLYYLLTRPEPTPLVVLRASAYPLQMPPLAFAEEDAELLTKVSPHNVRMVPVAFESSSTSLDEFRKALQAAGGKFNPFGRGNNLVIVHIAAHGVLDPQRRPCLVPSSANPFDSTTWLPLEKVFEILRTEPAVKDKKKLVLLDCQRVFSCWRCGWLENRFADEIGAAVKAGADPKLYVIAAAGSSEIGWAAPELRGSVFGHFLARGLRGEGNRKARAVSLAGLFGYLAREVDGYSQRRRGVHQQPTLFHGDKTVRLDAEGRLVDSQGAAAKIDDFALAYIDARQRRRKLQELQTTFDPLSDAKRLLGSASADKLGGEAGGANRSLHQVWQLYRQRRQPLAGSSDSPVELAAYSIDPVAWASVQQRLAAVGERLLAGRQYQGTELQKEIDRLAKELADQWKSQGALPSLDRLQVLREDGIGSSGGKSPGGENLLEAYWKTEPAKRNEALPRNISRVDLIKDIYDALGDTAKAADARLRLATAAELLERVSLGGNLNELLESHFVALLDRGLARNQPLSSRDLATALRSRQIAEQAANPADLRGHYFAEALVNVADEKRRQAEDLLFAASDSREVERLWSEALGQESGAEGYAAAMRRTERMGEFLRLRDEVWAELPLLAEWHFVRAGFGSSPPRNRLLGGLVQSTIELDDCLERTLRTRDEPSGFAALYGECEKAYKGLSLAWEEARAELESIYELPTNKEQIYRRPADLRDAELAILWPPLAGNSNQFIERYQQTLLEWAKQSADEDASGVSSTPDSVGASGSQRLAPSDNNEAPPRKLDNERYAFLQELHRALAYEFAKPFKEHRYARQWDEKQNADLIFRGADAGEESAWNRLKRLLDAYNEAMNAQSPTRSDSQRSLDASARLRQWDRRVRVAGSWLCCFQAGLGQPKQPTPAGWLQKHDAGHLTAWHAYRAQRDFWGNGLTAASTDVPFFKAAVDRCEAALPEWLQPIRYDLPGGRVVEDFTEEHAAAMQALRQWNPIDFPRRLSVSSGGDSKIEVAVQPSAASVKDLHVPPGTATLSFWSPAQTGSGLRISFDQAGQNIALPVPMPGDKSLTIPAFVQPAAEGAAVTGASPPDARLWYRGHVRTRPCPLGQPARFVEYEFERPRYSAPTVEVRGKDAPRGSIMFVFDCSASMQGPNFKAAKSEFQGALDELWRRAGSALHCGLIAYGRQTNAGAAEYHGDSRREDLRPLSPNGQPLDPLFVKAHPHPDGDVSTLVPINDGTANNVLAALNGMRSEDCRGVTPLYYSIRYAIDNVRRNAPGDGVRQIVVISDGVNMPYNCFKRAGSDDYEVGATGKTVIRDDYAQLEKALQASQDDVHVTIQLFGTRGTDFERGQYKDLKTLDSRHPNLEVIDVRAGGITQSILDSLPKTRIELSSAPAESTGQTLTFNQPQEVKDWGSDGLLRREPEHRLVRLTPPGAGRAEEKELGLVGGERVVVEYDARDEKLRFRGDGLVHRAWGDAKPSGSSDAGRKLLFDALDPERSGSIIQNFHFRIRDEQAEQRFTPRPSHVWLEISPRLSNSAADVVFPCIDAIWVENVNLPHLQAAVKRWPECSQAHVRAWFRYSQPQGAETVLRRGDGGMTLDVGAEKWRIEQDAGTERRLTVSWEPRHAEPGLEKLLGSAVWLSPAPETTHRLYAPDGSMARHEFTYSRGNVSNDVRVQIVSRAQFQQGAYAAEFEFDIAK
jgi:hypothetical protein